MKKLEDFLKPTQKELFGQLRRMYPNAVVNKGAGAADSPFGHRA